MLFPEGQLFEWLLISYQKSSKPDDNIFKVLKERKIFYQIIILYSIKVSFRNEAVTKKFSDETKLRACVTIRSLLSKILVGRKR